MGDLSKYVNNMDEKYIQEVPMQGGESFFDIKEWVVPWMEEIINPYKHNKHRKVVVGHGALIAFCCRWF